MKRYVTCSINRVVDFVNGVPHFKRFKYAIECDDLTKAYDVARDINSIDGIQYIRICKTNKDKTRTLFSQDDYSAL